jgi:hypothetical protein
MFCALPKHDQQLQRAPVALPLQLPASSHLVRYTYSMQCNGASTIGHPLVGNATVH